MLIGILELVIWITGLTASGETTLGMSLEERLNSLGNKKILRLDGDELRKRKKFKNGHSISDRWFNLELIVEIVLEEEKNYEIIIVSTVSHISEMRTYARKRIKNFNEIYLKCNPNICEKRDYKMMYNRAKKNELDKDEVFPGVTEPYQVSKNPELVLQTDLETIDQSINKLFSYCKQKL